MEEARGPSWQEVYGNQNAISLYGLTFRLKRSSRLPRAGSEGMGYDTNGDALTPVSETFWAQVWVF